MLSPFFQTESLFPSLFHTISAIASRCSRRKPQLTIIQGGIFHLSLVLPPEYPFKAPTLSFKTRIYHPNVTNDEKGSMCIGILKSEAWKPSSKILAVLVAVQDLLREPVPDDALEASIADKYKNDRATFEKEAKEAVKRYAR